METHATTKDKIAVCVFALLCIFINEYTTILNITNRDVWSVFFIALFAIIVTLRSSLLQKWFVAGMVTIINVQLLIFVGLDVIIDELPPYGIVSLGTIYAVAMGSILELSKKFFGHS